MTIKIEIFTASNCGKCGKATHAIKAIIDELGAKNFECREINVLKEIDYAVSLSVITTPSIAINGEIIFTAQPSTKQLRKTLVQYMKEL